MKNLEILIEQQSKQIAQLTNLVGAFLLQNGNQSLEKNKQAMLYLQQQSFCGNIENLISQSNVVTQFQTKEIEEMHKRIINMDNVRFRVDSRYEWRKMVAGILHHVVERDPQQFLERLSKYKKDLKGSTNGTRVKKQRNSQRLIDLLWAYHNRYRVGKIKPASIEVHETTIRKHMTCLTKDIWQYSKDDIQDFLNSISFGRIAQICYLNLKSVFAEATENGIIKRNVIATLKKPVHKVDKGSWLVPADQRKLLENLPQTVLGKEILFYLLTGARLIEGQNTNIDFDKRIAYIKRPKTEKSGVIETAVPLSEKFCNFIKDDWHKMFKSKRNWQGKQITDFFASIGIKGKSTHDLRHTFSTNIYYLGVDPKMHQYLMGHTTLKMSYDVYTSLVPHIKKQDITDIWGDWYPQF